MIYISFINNNCSFFRGKILEIVCTDVTGKLNSVHHFITFQAASWHFGAQEFGTVPEFLVVQQRLYFVQTTCLCLVWCV